MGLSTLGSLLESVPEFERLVTSLEREHAGSRVQVQVDAAPFALSTLWRKVGAPMLVVAPRPEDARRLHEQLLLWDGDEGAVLHFPETEALPFERLVSDVDTTQQRLLTLSRLAGGGGGAFVPRFEAWR